MRTRQSFGLLALLTLAVAAPGRPAAAETVSCPSSKVPNFRVGVAFNNGACQPGNVVMAWDPLSLTTSVVYEVLASPYYADYCSVPSSIPFSVIGPTSKTSFSTQMPAEKVAVFAVQVQGCPQTRSVLVVGDSFGAPPAAPVPSATVTGAGQITVKISQPDAKTFKVATLERSLNGGTYQTVVPDSQTTFQNYCPGSG